MYFKVLGPQELDIDGSTTRLDSAKQRVILSALLTAANDVVPLERLIDWCWPRRPPRSAAAIVQAHISRLRRFIEPDRQAWSPPSVLLSRPPGYLIELEPEQLDMLRFEELIGVGEALLGGGDARGATETLARALALWRGTPLCDVAHVEAAQATVARLEALRLTGLVTRIDADLRLGCDLTLVPELTALVRRYPFDERLCGQLMIALYRCGRQAESLAAYARLRAILAKELKIAPAPASRRLQQAILAQHPDLEPHRP